MSDSGSGSEKEGSGSPSKSGSGSPASSDDEAGFVRRSKKAPRPKKRGGASAGAAAKRARYIDAVAQESDADEDDDDDAEERQEKVNARLRKEEAARRARLEKQKSAAEIAAELEARYKAGGYRIGGGDSDFEAEEAEGGADARLPSISDPKLWLLRCKEGEEANIIVALMNKYVALAEAGQPVDVMSASSTSKGRVLVEAFREAQVRTAVSGISDLYGWKPDAITLVPVPQMTAALRVTSSRVDFTRGQFVRVARGVYKGDLAQVVRGSSGGEEKLLIRLVPRINFAYFSLPKEARGFGKGRPGGFGGPRPPPRLYDRGELTEAIVNGGGNPTAIEPARLKWGMRLDLFGGNAFSGTSRLLYKEVAPAFLAAGGTPPSLEELAKFQMEEGGGGEERDEHEDEEDEEGEEGEGGGRRRSGAGAGATEQDRLLKSLEQARANVGASLTFSSLSAGDAVAVVRGDLAGLTGRVVAVNAGGTFTLEPSAQSKAALGMNAHLEVPLDEAAKTFEPGDHVKVYAGMYAGETGTVTGTRPADEGAAAANATSFLVRLLLDSGSKSVEVFAKDLAVTTDVVSCAASIDGFTLHDLVELPGEASSAPAAGVIVGLVGQREVRVLQTSGKDVTVAVAALRGKVSAGRGSAASIAMDVAGLTLQVGDVVRVITTVGENKDAVGTIKHIHKSFLFLHDFKRPDNAGIFVVRSRYAMLVTSREGGAGGDAGGVAAAPTAPSRPGFGSKRRLGPGGDAAAGELGKNVIVLKGRWKAKLGIVRGVSETQYTVELHGGQQKHITVAHGDVKKVGDHGGALHRSGAGAGAGGGASEAAAASVYGGGGKTPMFPGLGGATPAYVGPFGDGETPMYGEGGKTPLYGEGGKTPLYGEGGKTPLYGEGGKTPLYGEGGRTPLYGEGGKTPMYAAGGGGRTPLQATAAGGRTPLYGGEGGGRTPLLGAGGGGGGGGDDYRSVQATKAAAVGVRGDAELQGSWVEKQVLVSIEGGPHAGKKGHIKEGLNSRGSLTVSIDGMPGSYAVKLADVMPVLATSKSVTGSFVRVLGGAFKGQRAKITAVEDEETLLLELGEAGLDLESIPMNICIVMTA